MHPGKSHLLSDFIIIGGGISGLATAFKLRSEGAAVTLLERNEIGRESSWAGGGILYPLLPWDYTDPVNLLTRHSLDLYPQWIADIAEHSATDPEYRTTGMLVLPQFDLPKARAWCEANNTPYSHTQPFPGLPQGLWLPNVTQVRNPRLVRALREACQNIGVKLHENTTVNHIYGAQEHVSHLIANGQEWHAEQYILCSGAWSSKLLDNILPQRDLKPMRGQMLLYKTEAGALPTILYQNSLYLIPRQDGHILAGSTVEDAGFDKSSPPETLSWLARRSGEIFPLLADLQPIHHWAGLRPGSRDNIPLISRHPGLQNMWLNLGHFRYGVTMAPGSADLLAQLIAGEKPPLNMMPYQA